MYTDVVIEEKDTENNNSDTENDNDGNKNGLETASIQENFQDNMVLEIPLGLPADNQNEDNQASEELQNSNSEYEQFSDQRLREIIDELRDDPELRAIFHDQENEPNDEDEGVELRTLEEEVMLDIEPFDYRLEVELDNWENQM